MWRNRKRTATRFVAAAISLAALAALSGGQSTSVPGNPQQVPPIRHVFVIVLENASYTQSYDTIKSKHPYLAKVLRNQGVLLNQYYATSHYSLGNYLAVLGGVAPNTDTQRDCPAYLPMQNTSRAPMGQVKAHTGCIYPASVPTLAGQLTAKGLTWKGYMEDMGNNPAREQASCGKPSLGNYSMDQTQNAAVGDAYAARHNPFLYFASVAAPACAANVVPLNRMSEDLARVETTPNFSFISPSLCNDGHEMTCTRQPAGPAAEDAWLRTWVEKITASPAYRADGALFIINDEADGDSSACCHQPSGPNVAHPGYPPIAAQTQPFTQNGTGGGKGGGRTGALVISPFIRLGGTSSTPYNHYSLLKSIEEVFGLSYLGYAGQPGLNGFGTDVWTGYNSTSDPTGNQAHK